MSDYNDLNNKLECLNSIQKKDKKDDSNNFFSLRNQLCFFGIGFSYLGLEIISFIVSLIATLFIQDNLLLANTVVNTASYLILFAIFLIFILIERKTFIKKITKGKSYLYGIGFGIALIFAEILIGIIIGFFYQGPQNENQQVINEMFNTYPTISFIILCIVGPFCEEITYRVGLFDLFKRKNKILAYIITIIVFAFIHLKFTDTTVAAELSSLPIYLAIGFFLTLAYDKFDLPASFIAHVILNSMSFISVMLIQ